MPVSLSRPAGVLCFMVLIHNKDDKLYMRMEQIKILESACLNLTAT